MPSIDLTTLSGWVNLSDGTHNITIVAKADGYLDSDPSHAERLIREGKKIHSENADTIWEWVTRLAVEQISECRYKLSKRG